MKIILIALIAVTLLGAATFTAQAADFGSRQWWQDQQQGG